VLVFGLLLLRVYWRRTSPPPALPASMTGLEAFAAHAGHLLLYAAMLMLPVTGYLDSAFGGYHVSVFGLFDIPLLFEKANRYSNSPCRRIAGSPMASVCWCWPMPARR
jgi:cytochrome b561